jgi:hypothetical protein
MPSKTFYGKEKGTFSEEGTFEHEGRAFTSGGAYIGKHKVTGKLGGLLYAFEKEGKVGSWDGKLKIPARFGKEYRDNFGGTRQTVYFTYQGKQFMGVFFKSQGDIVRVREIKG